MLLGSMLYSSFLTLTRHPLHTKQEISWCYVFKTFITHLYTKNVIPDPRGLTDIYKNCADTRDTFTNSHISVSRESRGGCPEPLNRHMVVDTDSLLHEGTALMSVPMSYHGSGLVIKAFSYCLPPSFHPPGHDTARRPLLNTMLVLRFLDL